MMRNSLKMQNRHVVSHFIMVVWCFIVLFPLWVLLVNSFKTRLSIYENPFWIPKKWNFQNYVTVLQDGDFINYFKNSLVVVLLSLLVMTTVSALAGYALANWKSKVSRFFYFFLIAGMMLPIKIASIKLLEIMQFMHLLNTIWSLPPIYVAMGIPVGVFILTEFIRQIPQELTEAGIIDGAGRFRIFYLIIVPLVKPALATVSIYNLIPFWNDLWFPLIFINEEKSKTLLLGVTRLFGQYQTDWSKVLAVLTLSAIPVLFLYLLMSQQFIKGVTAGAVKG
ncbi:ABC-type sugar transport system, permease component [Sphaerochaeta pleomorpha str. Grapes]|uniref:sn-glycerol-3-phosphate transport system permease protein UgpE n=1 Tax=Sphaerochaeta pleomorpha (strain ATCC BAA-1885 / DSM 22778 / Grapes) TaxID=158190 RepID=G8QUZ4_SPHPG|nr:carbohydrate ABC transporter permease [Sphaerochaeta pleomorpha]AEV28170.1 ABC-type sugar transport system, permease component [Sphaerochaeta pleomorpha str. Grapes]